MILDIDTPVKLYSWDVLNIERIWPSIEGLKNQNWRHFPNPSAGDLVRLVLCLCICQTLKISTSSLRQKAINSNVQQLASFEAPHDEDSENTALKISRNLIGRHINYEPEREKMLKNCYNFNKGWGEFNARSRYFPHILFWVDVNQDPGHP